MGARPRQKKRRASSGTGIGADGVVSERRKNGDGFPVAVANRQRNVGALAASGRRALRNCLSTLREN